MPPVITSVNPHYFGKWKAIAPINYVTYDFTRKLPLSQTPIDTVRLQATVMATIAPAKIGCNGLLHLLQSEPICDFS